jgi:endonuclease/exonuclease/phosphatase (EEP) superfamily protein YafD
VGIFHAAKTGGLQMTAPVRAGRLARLAGGMQRGAAWLAGLLVLATVLRVLFRDRFTFTAPLFYALPLPVLMAGWILLALVWWRKNRRRWLVLVLAAVTGIFWTQVSWKRLPVSSPAPAGQGTELEVLFWNIGHRPAPPERLLALLRTRQPDLVALAESEELPPAAREQLVAALPGSQLLVMPDGMVALARGSLRLVESRRYRQKTFLHRLEVSPADDPGRAWQLVLTDVGPWPPLPRTALLEEVFAAIPEAPRTVVAGDFNTPFDSAALDSWRARYHHGFAHCPAGSGPLETWGMGLPLLAIDHQWCSRDLAPVAAEKGWQWPFDHQWLLVKYRG